MSLAVCTAGLCGNETTRGAFVHALYSFSLLGTGRLLEHHHVCCVQALLRLDVEATVADLVLIDGSSKSLVFDSADDCLCFAQDFYRHKTSSSKRPRTPRGNLPQNKTQDNTDGKPAFSIFAVEDEEDEKRLKKYRLMLKMQTPPEAVRHVPSQRFFFSSSSHLSGIDRWESSSSIGDVVYKKEGTEEKENDVILTPAGLSLEKHLESLSGMNNDNDGKSSSSSVKTTYSDEYHRSSSSSAVSSSSSLSPILPVEDLPFATLGELESYVTAIESVASLSITHAYTQQYLFPLVESCSNLRSQAGARLAERILAHCLECVEQYRHTIDDADNHNDEEYIVEWRDAPHPTKDMYTMVTDSWGRCGTTGGYGARRAKLILDLMIDEYEREKKIG